MQEQIIRIIAELQKDPELTNRLNGQSSIVRDSGMESLQIVQFILQVEKEFGTEIDFDTFDMSLLDSVERFSEYVRRSAAAAL
ncbi:hypothetical protein J19TS2_27190 [Cohnella xylanilytica]|uniref:Acyl carrier protein n=1 Tax=Cohnella xylanilytica TaxID=557555 RepID=A0A841UBA0_9BACL|nr:acyl carrier protein [Cohnella xylanilytica]MBB6695231.1 acyl carrier protein [Cohnella xylanilytica]GIO13164.1 hypothetical protein J19TS2_27190 [Cohnella xylanilytica]